ncbi:MAG: hypothetical protein F4Y02_07685 [Chloroflexi bacterium]|nr:hypothetical protein [Chloroflexota bacterium]
MPARGPDGAHGVGGGERGSGRSPVNAPRGPGGGGGGGGGGGVAGGGGGPGGARASPATARGPGWGGAPGR